MKKQRIPSMMNPNRPTPRHIKIKMAKVKGKERILKVSREKQRVNYKGTPHKVISWISLQKLFRSEGHGKIYSKS